MKRRRLRRGRRLLRSRRLCLSRKAPHYSQDPLRVRPGAQGSTSWRAAGKVHLRCLFGRVSLLPHRSLMFPFRSGSKPNPGNRSWGKSQKSYELPDKGRSPMLGIGCLCTPVSLSFWRHRHTNTQIPNIGERKSSSRMPLRMPLVIIIRPPSAPEAPYGGR